MQSTGSSNLEIKKLLKKKMSLQVISGNVKFTWDEILRATKCFSKNMVVGEGGFSIVYRGRLENGKEVAVKRAKKVNAINHPHICTKYSNSVSLFLFEGKTISIISLERQEKEKSVNTRNIFSQEAK